MEHLTLLETLKSKSITLKIEDIEAIMDEELSKDPEEMDTDLIDLCVNAINESYDEKEASMNEGICKIPSKKNIWKKILSTAAILTLSIGIAIPVSAHYIDNETLNQIVQYIEDHFSINLSLGNRISTKHSDNNNALIQKLKTIGYENIILPSVFLEQDYSDDAIKVTTDDDFFLCTEIRFKLKPNMTGYISIEKHKTEDSLFALGQADVSEDYDLVKKLTINGVDVVVFSSTLSDAETFLKYIDNHVEYSIYLANCDLDTAIEIAKTLN